jgi:hypothetical protein
MLLLSFLAVAEVPPVFSNASQVLEQFTKSRENLNSFIVTAHEKSTYTYPGFKGIGRGYKNHEWRFDGNRCKNIESVWGDINIKVRDVKEEDADYQSTLWDGQIAYIYDYAKNPFVGKYVSGARILSDDEIKVCSESFKRTLLGEIMGYHWGDDIRIGELFLKPSTKLQLRDRKSNVGGVDCYVIEADVPGKGKYTVWIDPVHDFHIARIQVQRKTGDHIWNQVVIENDAPHKEFYEVLEFEKVGDAWFPKTCKIKRVNQSNAYHSTEENEISISSITLNPYHDALGSFLPSDIPNGVKVYLRALSPDIEFVWQDGKPIPNTDNVAIKQIGKKTEKIPAERKKK